MKVTKEYLKTIIKEELNAALEEQDTGARQVDVDQLLNVAKQADKGFYEKLLNAKNQGVQFLYLVGQKLYYSNPNLGVKQFFEDLPATVRI